jgi:hypothetical protein
MVKQIFSFVRWQVARFTWSDYLWFLACGMVGFGWEQKGLVFFLGMFLIFVILFSSLVGSQWERWKEERKQLLETIKDSK